MSSVSFTSAGSRAKVDILGVSFSLFERVVDMMLDYDSGDGERGGLYAIVIVLLSYCLNR